MHTVVDIVTLPDYFWTCILIISQESFNLKHIVDAPENSSHPKIISEKERQKSLKKRCKKLRQRMMSRGAEFENSVSLSTHTKAQIIETENKAK